MKLFAPNACVFCRAVMAENDAPICSACHADLPFVPQALALPPPPLAFLVAPLAYEFPVNAAIRLWKYRRRLEYTPAFTALLIDALAALPEAPDILLPVPLHWRRQALRGFNQAEELARPVGRALGVPLRNDVRRVRHTPSQSGLGAAERRQNLRAAFHVRGRIDTPHVLIVDDVVTTGATTARLARELLRVGAERVSVVAIARTV